MGKRRKRGPQWLQRLKLTAMVTIASLFVWCLRLTCRIKVVSDTQYLDGALACGVVIPCCWHQQVITSGLFLRSLVKRGLCMGFLISPSREGEFIAQVATRHGTKVMRGSSTRTGKQALTAMTEGIKQGISPTLFGDGPQGPARVFKPGAIILAQRTGTPIMPVSCRVDRYWQLNSWDKTRLPKPFARITVAVGKLVYIEPNTADIDATARRLGDTINHLTAQAEQAQ